MEVNLTIPCLLFMIVTIYLYCISKTNDKYLLGVMIFGQVLLLIGSILKNYYLIDISHIIFLLTIIIGVFVFQEKYNKYLVAFSLLATLSTRKYFDDCLFLMATDNKKIINVDELIDINWDKIFSFLLFLLIIKELY
tara:strand:+ start:6256 stop:6666 length:411 start_codon:yes stop_codon:yes gene_type:complete